MGRWTQCPPTNKFLHKSSCALSVRWLGTVSASASLCSAPGRTTSPWSARGRRATKPTVLAIPLLLDLFSSTATSAAANFVSTASQNAQGVIKCAGNASLHSNNPCDPLSPLQLDADVDWNADSGATSYMTPHPNWLHNYTPHHVPIKLADNTVVYSADVGSVVFNPVIKGQSARAVEFTRDLHVSDVLNNLLSV